MLRSLVGQQHGVVFKPRYCIPSITKRYFSNHDMMEAFGAPPSKPASSSISSSNKSSSPTDLKTEKKIDPAININRDFSSSLSSTNSTGSSNSGTIDQVFGSSLNDFSSTADNSATTNWSNSFHGLGVAPFSKESQDILYTPLPDNDIEITPDGLLYLPEIKYRRILNRAFGAGAWGLAPRSATLVSKQGMGGLLTREYGLVVHGRLVSIARGEQAFFNEKGIPTATEGCKSNALMRCCKDLGIASELWDPRFIKSFKKKNCEDLFVEYIPTKKKKKIWKRKDEAVEYPFKK